MRPLFACSLLLLAAMPLPVLARGALRVVTSFPQDAAIAQAVGGAHVAVQSLATASKDPHAIQPRPNFGVALNRADLLITNGQQMDLAWLPIALANARNPKIGEGFDPSKGVHLLPYTREELADTPFFNMSVAKYGNHHYWLDPANGLVEARNIAGKLAELDPADAAAFRANERAFEAGLTPKIAAWDKQMAPFAGMPVVSYHRDWIYLIHRHHLRLEGYVEPRETIPPSAGEVTKLVTHMRAAHVKVVLTSPWQNQRIAGEVARLAGAVNVMLPSSVGKDVGVEDYADMFRVIYGRLVPALLAAKAAP